MAQIPDRIAGIIRRFIEELENNQIHVAQAVLFGSHAAGTYDDWSDIDLAVVSDSFEGERFHDRTMIGRITVGISSELEPLPCRPEDFTIEDPFVRKVLETGVRIV